MRYVDMNRKGISPLIAAVLLIAFTLAVAAIVSGFFTSIAKTGTTQISTGFALQVNCTKAAIEVVDAFCTVNAITVAATNTGPISLTDVSIIAKNGVDETCLGTFAGGNFGPSNLTAFNFTCGSEWAASDVLQLVRVTANCQNEKAISAEKSNINEVC